MVTNNNSCLTRWSKFLVRLCIWQSVFVVNLGTEWYRRSCERMSKSFLVWCFPSAPCEAILCIRHQCLTAFAHHRCGKCDCCSKARAPSTTLRTDDSARPLLCGHPGVLVACLHPALLAAARSSGAPSLYNNLILSSGAAKLLNADKPSSAEREPRG